MIFLLPFYEKRIVFIPGRPSFPFHVEICVEGDGKVLVADVRNIWKIFSSWTRSGSRFTRFASSIRTLHRSFRAKTNARETPFSRFWSLRWASRWRRREQVELDLQWRKGNLRQDLVDQFVERVLNRYCLQLEGARVQLVQITRVDVTDMIYSSQMKIFYNIIKLIDLLDLTLKNFTPLFTRVAYSHTYFISSNRFLLLL